MIEEKLKKLILAGKFEAAEKEIVALGSEQSSFLLHLACDTDSTAPYGFMVKMLLDNETAYWHFQAWQVFTAALCHFEGAEPLDIHHSRCAMDLEPNSIDYKRAYLAGYGPPTYLVHYDDAIKVAKEILAVAPNNEASREVLEAPPYRMKLEVSYDDTDFYSLLYYGKLKEARALAKDLTLEELFDFLTDINNKKPTLVTYGYLVLLMLEHETAELHYLASRILIEQLNQISGMEGAYAVGFWHAKRAVELDPMSVAYKEHLLKFETLPGEFFNKNEIRQLAKEIVALDPQNMSVFRIFDEPDITT